MKSIYLFLIITLIFSCNSTKKYSTSSSNSNSSTAKCIKGDCVDGLGTYQFGNGEKYEGYYRNGKRNGYGIYYFKNGDISWGGNKNGKNHGVYYYKWEKTGITLKGSYHNGEKNGHFDWYETNGEIIQHEYYVNGIKSKSPESQPSPYIQNFTGDYITVNLKTDGSYSLVSNGDYIELSLTPTNSSPSRITLFPPGHNNAYYLIDNNNKKYELYYQEGFKGDGKNGFGTRTLNEKITVELKFKSFNSESIETLSLIEGECEGDNCWNFKTIALPKIEGCLVGNCRSEYGIKKNNQSSLGFLYGSDDIVTKTYAGFFKNGKYHGEGMLTFSDGKKWIGSFNEGYFEGEGTIFYKDGNKYIGETYDEVRQGNGKFYQSGYLAFSGKWQDDEPAYGTGYNSNGTVIHKGYWEDWKPKN